ncbi:hypothetical protein BCV70DRAFT_198492 [Testicularia cyperi]|uniref:Uncharacterized protein n=1 Tax=Testicularia cyperi TaxID=1882483 RepID=A0A317XV51_9BASI|nr:hypothetical protein BCV70DRAFT_198492 [Testicularia cyperi]
MQSTAAAIASAAIGGIDLAARANSNRGSDTAASTSASSKKTLGTTQSGFDSKEAERWMDARWKTLHSSVGDQSIPTEQRTEVYKAAPGTAGSAWGPNKKTVNERFANDFLQAASAAGL